MTADRLVGEWARRVADVAAPQEIDSAEPTARAYAVGGSERRRMLQRAPAAPGGAGGELATVLPALWDAPAATALLINRFSDHRHWPSPSPAPCCGLPCASVPPPDEPTSRRPDGNSRVRQRAADRGTHGDCGWRGDRSPSRTRNGLPPGTSPRLPPSSHAKGTLPRRASALTGG
ncbi:hypothetical protein GCM10012280_30110 [Wenjunlia tyrosinilytica]|uniref:Uncharacterized protein n=1 Tax=Wenjunlia tyrosinilytica TaxID=1544741 RepID=A0A917ZQW9_9ACTN|nr:hypothetical protein GCM10012280_30110 [Wenjunlia tyrosinilytica]